MAGAQLQLAGDGCAGREFAGNDAVQQFVSDDADQRFPSQFSPFAVTELPDGQVYLRVFVPYATLAFKC